MSIRGKYPYYIVDTLAERDSLINVDFPERIECLVTNSGETPPLSQLFTYASGSWLLIGGAIVAELFELSGQAGKYAKVKGDESGYEFAALAGGGDMVGANNLSDVADQVTSQNNLGINNKFSATADIAAFLPVTSTGRGADSSNTAHISKVIGINVASVLNGFIGYAVGSGGTIKNAGWSWTVGDKIFLNGTTLSTTAPSTGFSQQIGTAVASDTIAVKLSPAVLLN